MAETQRKSHLMSVSDTSNWIGLGVDTSKNGGKASYMYRIAGDYYPSQVSRSKGWHQFKWDYSSGKDVKLYIDDALVATTDKVKQFNKIELGDFWQSDATVGYYDDLSIVVNDHSQMILSLPEQVKSGDIFEVVIGVSGMNTPNYTQELTINYDSEVLELLEEDGIQAIEPTVYVEGELKEGYAKILLETSSGLQDGDTVRLKFKACIKSMVETEIKVEQIQLEVVNGEVAAAENIEAVQGTIIVIEGTPIVDKNGYNEVIHEAEALAINAEIGINTGQYPQESKDRLTQAIEEAKSNGELSEDQEIINHIIDSLREEIKIFKEAMIRESSMIVDKNEYENTIQEAEGLAINAEIGSNPGQYPEEAKVVLIQAIEEAKKINESNENQETIDEITNSLKAAMTSFRESIIKPMDNEILEEEERALEN